METLLLPTDVVRLVDIVRIFAGRLGCGMHEAVCQIDQIVAGPQSVRRPRRIAAFADRIRSVRARRNEWMQVDLFRDPSWDMMLDLFGADAEGRSCNTSALCIGSGAPATTALRHIDRLERSGMITRSPHRRDHRCVLVDFAPGVRDRLEILLARLQDCY